MKVEQSKPLTVSRDGATAWLMLNRPDKRNAINDDMLGCFADAMRHACADDEIRTIVLGGNGAGFSAGRDRKDVGAGDAQHVRLEDESLDKTVDLFTDALIMLLECPKPTIAAVHGFALGGGQAMTLACDFVVAESGAKFGNVEITYGFPAALNAVLLGRYLGRRVALEIALSGSLYTAKQFHGLGLVNRLAERGTLQRSTRDFVAMLNDRAPWAVRRTKALMRMSEDAPLPVGMFLGGQLNQLLRLNSVSSNPYGNSASALQQLRKAMKQNT